MTMVDLIWSSGPRRQQAPRPSRPLPTNGPHPSQWTLPRADGRAAGRRPRRLPLRRPHEGKIFHSAEDDARGLERGDGGHTAGVKSFDRFKTDIKNIIAFPE